MGKVLNKIWYDRTIRTQLLIAFGVINLVAAVIAGVIWVANARSATRVEMDASVQLAKNFARVAIQSLSPDGQPIDLSKRADQLASRLRVGDLRHVRIYMADANGNLVQLRPRRGHPAIRAYRHLRQLGSKRSLSLAPRHAPL